MVNSFIENYQKKLIEVLEYTIKFLEENNLTWYVCGGTAIGAVRHNDIIPWDDDIDIFLPRSDYNRLLEISGNMLNDNYKLFSLRDKGYYHPYYKVVDMKTTIWENRLIPYVLGVYVDVFPLEDTDITPAEYARIHDESMKLLTKYHRSLAVPTLSTYIYMLTHNRLLNFKDIVENFFYYKWNRNRYLRAFMEKEKEYFQPEGKKYAYTYGFAGPEKDLYNKEWFNKIIKYPFSYLEVNVPAGYDAYLTQVYGDYMTPPPEEKRVLTHDSRYYINIKERLNIREIEKRVKNGLTREY